MTKFILLTINVLEEYNDFVSAVVSGYPIVGIEEGTDSLVVCFEQNDWIPDYAESIIEELKLMNVPASIGLIGTEEDQNWNAEWEASIDPVIVNDRIVIVPHWRAEEYNQPLKLVITPKMSFGTGHHATTRMMCRLMETRVEKNSSWIDVGTGTGVLAILAVKLGASNVFAFDNNEWSILNTQENVEANNTVNEIRIEQCELQETDLPPSDGLAANLYRHLVIPYAPAFVKAVKPKGWIIVSGILKYDADEVAAPFLALNCTLEERLDESEWCALAFTTPEA